MVGIESMVDVQECFRITKVRYIYFTNYDNDSDYDGVMMMMMMEMMMMMMMIICIRLMELCPVRLF
jgi:hypothetical protein